MDDEHINRRGLLALVLVVVAVVGIVVVRQEIDARRVHKLEVAGQQADLALYRQLPLYPGAVETGRFTIGLSRGVDGPVDRYTLSIDYQIPGRSNPGQVFAFFAAHIPAGWAMASVQEQNCGLPTTTPTTVVQPPLSIPVSDLASPTTVPGSGVPRPCLWSTAILATLGQTIDVNLTVASNQSLLSFSRQ